MKKLFVAIPILFTCTFLSCKQNNVKPNPEPDESMPAFPDNSLDVYVAGTELNNNGVYVAKYWKNGKVFNLTNGAFKAAASSIFISNEDVYVLGYEYNAQGVAVNKYWKNGNEVVLSEQSANPYFRAIAVSNNNVYISGNNGYKAVCWINGHETILPEGSLADEVSVMGSDIFIAGTQRINGGMIARCWKNGQLYTLNDSLNSECFAIKAVGNDIYLGGYGQKAYGEKAFPKYWKNGKAVVVDFDEEAIITGMDISNNDVYLSGYTGFGSYISTSAGYWKNGLFTLLSDSAATYTIAAANDYVYVAGSNKDKAALWINGQLFFSTPNPGVFAEVKIVRK